MCSRRSSRSPFCSPTTSPSGSIPGAVLFFRYTPDRILFRDLNFGIDFQSRIGILGPNGIGKSTLVKVSPFPRFEE